MLKERVNIQYSIDMEELSAEVFRLVQRANGISTESLSGEFRSLSEIDEKGILSLNTLTHIDKARKKLASIDYALDDVSNIINGFLTLQVQTNLQQRQNQAQPTASPAPSSAQKLKEMVQMTQSDDL